MPLHVYVCVIEQWEWRCDCCLVSNPLTGVQMIFPSFSSHFTLSTLQPPTPIVVISRLQIVSLLFLLLFVVRCWLISQSIAMPCDSSFEMLTCIVVLDTVTATAVYNVEKKFHSLHFVSSSDAVYKSQRCVFVHVASCVCVFFVVAWAERKNASVHV